MKTATDDPKMNGCDCVLIKLYLYTDLHWAGLGPWAVVCQPGVIGEFSFWKFFLNQNLIPVKGLKPHLLKTMDSH